MKALQSCLPRSNARCTINTIRADEAMPGQVSALLLRTPVTHRQGAMVRGRTTNYDLRTIFVQGGGCGEADQTAAEQQLQLFLAGFRGAKGTIVSGGTRMFSDDGEPKNMITEYGIHLRDGSPANDLQVVGTFPALYKDFGLVQVSAADAVGTAVEMDPYKSVINPVYDAVVMVQKGPDAIFADPVDPMNIDYSGDLNTRYNWLIQQAQSLCFQVHFFYKNGGGVSFAEIVRSIALVMRNAFPAGATVVLQEGSGRKTDEVCAALADPTKRPEFCAKHFAGKEPTVVRWGADVTVETVRAYVSEFGMAPNVVIVPVEGLRAVNVGLDFITE